MEQNKKKENLSHDKIFFDFKRKTFQIKNEFFLKKKKKVSKRFPFFFTIFFSKLKKNNKNKNNLV